MRCQHAWVAGHSLCTWLRLAKVAPGLPALTTRAPCMRVARQGERCPGRHRVEIGGHDRIDVEDERSLARLCGDADTSRPVKSGRGSSPGTLSMAGTGMVDMAPGLRALCFLLDTPLRFRQRIASGESPVSTPCFGVAAKLNEAGSEHCRGVRWPRQRAVAGLDGQARSPLRASP